MEPSRREAVRLALVVWAVAVAFAVVTLVRSHYVGIPLRDPGGSMFRGRLASALGLLVVLALGDAVVRTLWTRPGRRPRGFGRGVVDALRTRWTLRRTALVLSGLVAYHVVYVCYRNLKSWDAFNTPHDQQLLALDRTLFLGHSPAVLLHGLLGQGSAAVVLAAVYGAFTDVVVLAVVGTLALVPDVRRAYLMLCAGVWAWILGVTSYYLVPSLGPFASAPQEFAGLRPTAITGNQAEYLAERSHLLADPRAGDAFASVSAFASLHVGFTCTILLVALHHRWRRTAAAVAVYLAAVIVSTIYFGYHFVVDDVAGVLIAVLAVTLARLMVQAPHSGGVLCHGPIRPTGAAPPPVLSNTGDPRWMPTARRRTMGESSACRGSRRGFVMEVAAGQCPAPEPDQHTRAALASYSYWIDDDRWDWSEAMFVLHGFGRGDVVPTTELLLAHKHPDDLESVVSVFNEAIGTGAPFACRHRIIDTRRHVHTVVWFGQVECRQGRPALLHGAMADVTDQLTEEVQAATSAALAGAMATRSVIDQAKGFLMGVYGIDADEAFDVLRTCSNRTNTKLHDVAEVVMLREVGRPLQDGGAEAAVQEVRQALDQPPAG